MAGNDPRNPANGGPGDPRDPERTAAHRLGPPMRPMRPGAAPDSRDADTGFIDRVTDDGAPVDVAAVRRDDDLIEALAAGGAVSTADDTEFTLASLLADWRDEIVTTPVPAGPSVDELMAEVERRSAGGDVTPIGEARSARRSRRFGMLAGSAAAAVAILGGGGVLVNSASPGDGALWNVKEVVFADAASQTLVTSEAKAQIQSADREASSGNQASAQTALVNARQNAAKVKNDKERAALEEQIRQAEARAGLPVGSTDIPPQSSSATAPTVVPPPPTSSVSVPPTILQQTLTTTPPYTPPTTTTRPPVTTTPPTTTEPTTTEPTTTEPTATTTTARPSTTTTTTEPASATATTTRPRPTVTTTTAAAASSPTFDVEPG